MKTTNKLERNFQSGLIRELKKRFPGCIVTKLDASYIQGIPDLLILWGKHWATLECKRSETAHRQPNQEHYLTQKRYQVTVIDKSPDSLIPDKVAMLPKCRHEQHFVSDNLHHDIFTLYD